MMLTKNEGALDRFLRVLVAELLFIGAFFWLGGVWAIVVYVLAAISFFTAITGFCALYLMLNINTLSSFRFSKMQTVVIVVVLFVIGIAGSYTSDFFSKKFFLEDFNKMNDSYKQTLFYTGQNKRPEALENYNRLVAAYPIFLNKYTSYHPLVFKFDNKFNADILKVSDLIIALKEQINTGDLPDAHKKLEFIRPIFQDILKRNGFSMLAVVLVDFHDAMEKIITAADTKDSAGLVAVYPEVDGKLQAVEEIANDTEIQAIRLKLNEVYILAKNGQSELLSAKAAELKSSFVKVYLKRG
jgi:hypothetical protein